MAIVRTRGPIARVRNQRFGGGARGSSFQGSVSLNLSGLTDLEQRLVGPEAKDGVTDILNEVGDLAYELAPKRTGQLANSKYVNVEVNGSIVSGEVGFSANHAAPVEFGAQGRTPQPFVRPAWDEKIGGGRGAEKLRELGQRLIVGLD